MSEERKCATCGAEIPAASDLHALCPRCLLMLGLGGDPEILKRIGNYNILSELGRGGMGVVYKAYQAPLNRVVALKVLPEEASRDPAYLKRFEREAASAAQISHPNVVAVYDVGRDGDTCYLAMEFVDGRTLSEVIHEAGQMTEPAALDVLRQACLGIAEAHRQGIIHRDLNPRNIMLDDAGRVRITDFGIAKNIWMRTDMTSEGAKPGTPKYMAPEQIIGKKTGPQADIYALGVTLYEMLAGSPPFQADSLAGLVHKVVYEPFPPIAEFNPGVSSALVRLIERMTARDPAHRFASIDEVLDHIEQITGGRNAGIAGGTRPRRQMRRRPFRFRALKRVSGRSLFLFAITAVIGLAALLWGGAFLLDLGGPIFADPNLEAAIREVLGQPTGTLDRTRLTSLTRLSARTRGIRDLRGLEWCANLEDLDLSSDYDAPDRERNWIGDAAPLKKLPRLKSLDIKGNKPVTDDVMSTIARLPSIEKLELQMCALSEEGLSCLLGMPRLCSAGLSHNQNVTDAFLQKLARLPNLAELAIDDCRQVTNTGLKYVAEARSLQRICLPSCTMNEGLASLAALPKLEWVMVVPPVVFDGESVRILQRFPALTDLMICEAKRSLTLDGFEELKKMERLRKISFPDPAEEPYTVEKLAELQAALPKCSITGQE